MSVSLECFNREARGAWTGEFGWLGWILNEISLTDRLSDVDPADWKAQLLNWLTRMPSCPRLTERPISEINSCLSEKRNLHLPDTCFRNAIYGKALQCNSESMHPKMERGPFPMDWQGKSLEQSINKNPHKKSKYNAIYRQKSATAKSWLEIEVGWETWLVTGAESSSKFLAFVQLYERPAACPLFTPPPTI